jgi:hypothetical protein
VSAQIYWEVEPVHELASYSQLIIVADWCINKMHPCNGPMAGTRLIVCIIDGTQQTAHVA